MNLEELLEEHRYCNVDYDWWDSDYDIFIEKMEDRGITIPSHKDIKFTGFHCQGDGASFTGYIHSTDVARFMEHHKMCEQYAATYYIAKKEDLTLRLIRRSSMYCHSNTIVLDIEDMGAPVLREDDKDNFREIVYCSMFQKYLDEVDKFEEEVISICRGYMDQLYDQLEDQFQYLTSDEAVLESLEMNNIYIPQQLAS